MKKALRFMCMAMAVTGMGATAYAQEDSYPSKPVKVLVGFAPGGAVDTAGRLMASELQKALGKSFVVENKPGAGGLLALMEGARAPADGYTIVVGSAGPLTVSPVLFKNQNFDPLKSLDPIALYMYTPGIVVAKNDLKVTDLKGLVAASKAGSLNMASAGTGSVLHLMGEHFQERINVKWVHIPYKGSSPALADMMGGRVDVMLDVLPSSAPLVKGGQIKALAVTSKRRNPQLPDVPTVAEQGFGDIELGSWMGMLVPKGTPPAIVAKLNKALNDSLQNPEVQKKVASLGSETEGGSAEMLAERIARETKVWRAVIEKNGIEAQ